MAISLVGRKVGMTRLFTETGVSIPVTVVEVLPNRITQLRTQKRADNSLLRSVQVTTGARKAQRVNKPEAGHFAKAGVEAGRGLWEFPLSADEGTDFKIGQDLTVEMFQTGQQVDVIGTTKGKGFAGTVKRHHFRTQDATHGNSRSHRVPGSIGQNQTPGRVFKGKKMCGHMGDVRRTAQYLEVVRVDTERHLLLIRGAVPGSPGGDVIIKPTVKVQLNRAETA